MMHKSIFSVILLGAIAASCSRDASLQADFLPKFEDKEVTLATYADTLTLATGVIKNGKVAFDYTQLSDLDMPILGQLIIDGRTRGIIVIEPGIAHMDTTYLVTGTPLNEKLGALLARTDSIEALDDERQYIKFIEDTYNANKDNPIGEFFGTELIRNLEAPQIDSVMDLAPAWMASSRRVNRYVEAAKLRKATAPGSHFVDFSAKQPDGSTASLSQYAGHGKWTLVDFWASWCPYCIKELPQLKELQQKYADKLQIVGVAVRDEADDTKAAVLRHNITWPVIFNAARKPYDIYGFTGIPHLMLISPDGTIVSRGENPARIAERLEK